MDGRRLQARENEAAIWSGPTKWGNVHATDGQGPCDFHESTVIVEWAKLIRKLRWIGLEDEGGVWSWR